MAEHIFKRFDDELNKLRYRLIKMGTLVQQQIELAINSLMENNEEHARLVLSIEQKVDKLDIKIDKQCLRIFALHQPVAMDLRLVLSTLSINDNMELIGDLATNIAKDVLALKLAPGFINKTKFDELSKTVSSLISKLMDSFVNMNQALSWEVINIDKRVNELYEENFHEITKLMKIDCNQIENCSYLLDINRNIQSIALQAKSIAQELIFLFEAKIIKHQYLNDEKNNEIEQDTETE